ncbi:MAG: hypothetical protein ABH950_08290 [Candidatus Altiarchaeota archaeon]
MVDVREHIKVSELGFDGPGTARVDELIRQVDIAPPTEDVQERIPGKRGGILIVRGDNESYWFSLERFLSSEGFTVHTFRIDYVKLRELRKLDYSLLILDWRHPKKEHTEMFYDLKMSKKKLSIILLTQPGIDEENIKHMRVDFFFDMPAKFDIIYAAINDSFCAMYPTKNLRYLLNPSEKKIKTFSVFLLLFIYLVADGIYSREYTTHFFPSFVRLILLIISFWLLPLSLTFQYVYAAVTDPGTNASVVYLLIWAALAVFSLWALASINSVKMRTGRKTYLIIGFIISWIILGRIMVWLVGFG